MKVRLCTLYPPDDPRPTDGICIEVWDTGSGLGDADPSQLFEPFAQGGGSPSKKKVATAAGRPKPQLRVGVAEVYNKFIVAVCQ